MAEVAGSYVHKFWHVVDEALSAILFLLIGLEVLIIPWTLDYVYFGGRPSGLCFWVAL